MTDFRMERCRKHNPVNILMVVLIGMLCNHKSIEEIHSHAELSEEDLQKYLELPNEIPGSDTILRGLAGIDGRGAKNPTKHSMCFLRLRSQWKSVSIRARPKKNQTKSRQSRNLWSFRIWKAWLLRSTLCATWKKIAGKNTIIFFPERKPGKKIHDGEKDFFNHELDEKYSQRYRIQNLRCGMEKDHNQIEKRECHIRTDL